MRRFNISTLSLADTREYGILRLLIQEHERARTVLEKAGYVVKETDVLALTVPDHPGGHLPENKYEKSKDRHRQHPRV